MIYNNPELRRNIWLEFSLHRIILMPLVIISVMVLVWMSNGDSRDFGFVLVMLVFLAMMWIAKNSASAVLDEIKERTWDSQRMTSLSPWSMTWGKLVGSALYPWYGLLVGLATYTALFGRYDSRMVTEYTAVFVAVIFGQTVSFLSGLISIRLDGTRFANNSFFHMLPGLLSGMSLYGVIRATPGPKVVWYGTEYHSEFFAVSALILIAWFLLASYRILRQELKYRSGILFWPLFAAFLDFYVIGFSMKPHRMWEVETKPDWPMAFSQAMLLNAALAVAMSLISSQSPISMKRFLSSLRSMRWEGIREDFPLWIVSHLFIYPLLVVYLVVSHGTDSFLFGSIWMIQEKEMFGVYAAFGFSLIFFNIRDLSILYFFDLNLKRKRMLLVGPVYLALLYLVFPFILNGMGLEKPLLLFWPLSKVFVSHPLLGMALGLGEALFLSFMVLMRWKRYFVTEESPVETEPSGTTETSVY